MATFPEFLQTISYNGRAVVGPWRALPPTELRDARRVLAELESHWRWEMPGRAPPFDGDAGLWGATLFYRACQLTVYRELGAEVIEREFATMPPTSLDASSHYSVDILLRFLPQLAVFAQRAATGDALVSALRRVGQAWPLSSVGMPGLGVTDAHVITAHPSLLALYVDRIINTKDATRLSDERVRDAVSAAVGMHTSLAAELAAKVAELQTEIVFLAEVAAPS